MIYYPLKLVFVHVPKTAGQSIESLFMSNFNLKREDLLLKQNGNENYGPPRLAHLTAYEYVAHEYVKACERIDYQFFSVVRNPYTRLISEYNASDYTKGLTFKTWVLNNFPKEGWCDRYRHIMPQYDYLHDSVGRLLIDQLFKFESLNLELPLFLEKCGLRSTSIPHINKSKTKFRSMLGNFFNHGEIFAGQKYTLADLLKEDRNVIDFINDFYRKDFESLNYRMI